MKEINVLNTYIDRILMVIFKYYLIIDTVNGVVIRSFSTGISISQLFKFILFFLLLIRIFTFSKVKGGIAYIYFCVFIVMSGFHALITQDVKALMLDVALSLKFSLVFLAYFYFKALSLVKEDYLRNRIGGIIKWNVGILAVNLVLGILGFGFSQYAGDIGSVGFFFAGNEVSGMMILLFSMIAYVAWEKGRKYYFYVMIFALALAFIKVTKVAIVGTVLIFMLIPFIAERHKMWRPTLLKFKALIFLSVSFPFIYAVFEYAIEKSGLLGRISYFYERLDIVTFILSGRNEVAFAAIKAFSEYPMLNQLLGVGKYIAELSVVPWYGSLHPVEIDFFDTLLQFGWLGVIIIYCTWFYFIRQSYIYTFKNPRFYGPPVLVSNIVLFIIAHTAGHIFNSGMIGVFVGLINGIIFLGENRFNEKEKIVRDQ